MGTLLVIIGVCLIVAGIAALALLVGGVLACVDIIFALIGAYVVYRLIKKIVMKHRS